MSREDAPNFRHVGVKACCDCYYYAGIMGDCEKHSFILEGIDGEIASFYVCDDWRIDEQL